MKVLPTGASTELEVGELGTVPQRPPPASKVVLAESLPQYLSGTDYTPASLLGPVPEWKEPL